MRTLSLSLLLILALGLTACGGGDAAPAAGDPVAGEKVYNEVAAPACITCHSLEPGVDLVGPSSANIGAEAGSRVSGQSAEDYLRESIVDPNAYVVEGYAQGLMPGTYRSQLTDQQVSDLVAYLLTLK
jgi:mono/diheme cytochrome c family protein